MSKEDKIKKVIDNFHAKCSKIESESFIDKVNIHEELIITTILEELIDDE